MARYNDLILVTDDHWLISSTANLWSELRGRYEAAGFIDGEITAGEMLDEFFAITASLKDFLHKLEKKMKALPETPAAWTTQLDSMIEKFNDDKCDRQELIYRQMRDDRVASLYKTIVNFMAEQVDNETEETEFYGKPIY